jgi:hypothetical protein
MLDYSTGLSMRFSFNVVDCDQMNWLEKLATGDADFERDGAEVWRNLKLAAETIVNSFNVIYCQHNRPDFEFIDCTEVNENCFRVRQIPNAGDAERYFEVRFNPARRVISVSPHPTPQPLPAGFGFGKGHDGKLALALLT